MSYSSKKILEFYAESIEVVPNNIGYINNNMVLIIKVKPYDVDDVINEVDIRDIVSVYGKDLLEYIEIEEIEDFITNNISHINKTKILNSIPVEDIKSYLGE